MTAVVGNIGDMFELQEEPLFALLLASMKAKSDVRNLIITGNKDEHASKAPEDFSGMQQTFDALKKFGKRFELVAGESEWKAFPHNEGEYQCDVLLSALALLPDNGNLVFTAKVRADGEDLFIYLDTNMFASKGRNHCYPLPIEEMRQLQEEVLFKLIRQNLKRGNYKRIIFVGHHPLCVFPFEKGMRFQVETNLIELISNLLQLLDEAPRILYLCSHHSVYQEQVVELGGQEIHLHIVGTGKIASSGGGDGSNQTKQTSSKKSSAKGVDYDAAEGVISVPALSFTARLLQTIKEQGYLFLPAASSSKEIEFRPLLLTDVGGRRQRRTRRRSF